MAYEVRLKGAARRDLKKLPNSVQKRLVKKIESLRENPRPPGVVKLEGEDNVWRVVAGPYRILYTIHDDVLLVLVIRVRARKEVYRR